MQISVMKIIFFGTSEFAIPSIRKVIASDHRLSAVITKSDRKSGRGLKRQPTPVSRFLKSDFPDVRIIHPLRLKDPGFLDELRRLESDLFLVASFPILPKEVVTIPRLGCLNLHPSLLPRCRGAAPIQWTLLKGERETGVSTFFIGGRVDSGELLLQRKMPVYREDNFGSLHDRLADAGAELIAESLDLISGGNFTTWAQDESLATPAPKIKPSDLEIDWSQTAESIHNRIRAFSPQPGAFTMFSSRRLKIFASIPLSLTNGVPGEGRIIDNTLVVGCGEGSLKLLEIQTEGKKRMPVEPFLRGLRADKIRFA